MSTTETTNPMNTIRKLGSNGNGQHRISLVEGDTKLPVSIELEVTGAEQGTVMVDFDEAGVPLGIQINNPVEMERSVSPDGGPAVIFTFGAEEDTIVHTVAGVRMDRSDEQTIKDVRMGYSAEGQVTWLTVGGVVNAEYREWATA